MIIVETLILLLNFYYVFPQEYSSDVGLSTVELITKYGYPVESHKVQTDDGYYLTLHRIPNVTNKKIVPVLLFHGILSSSADWVNQSPKKSLGFLLADAGFDVWMGNARGTSYSREHVTISPDTEPQRFFNFSFHEIGVFDLPATITHILNETKSKQINYVGHSQGTTVLLVMGSTRPEFNDKIKRAVLLAPVGYIGQLAHPVGRLVRRYSDLLFNTLRYFKIWELLAHDEYITELGAKLCGEKSELQEICAIIIFLFGGFDSAQLDRNFIPVISSNAPSGCSTKQFEHYIQETISGRFAYFDYGSENFEKYGSDTPPAYNLSRVTFSVSLYYAEKDLFVSSSDMRKLEKELPNVVSKKRIQFQEFSHLDFLFSKNVSDLVNKDLIEELKQ